MNKLPVTIYGLIAQSAIEAKVAPIEIRGDYNRGYSTDGKQTWNNLRVTDNVAQQYQWFYGAEKQYLLYLAEAKSSSNELKAQCKHELETLTAKYTAWGQTIQEIHAAYEARKAVQPSTASVPQSSNLNVTSVNEKLQKLAMKYANDEISKADYDEMKTFIMGNNVASNHNTAIDTASNVPTTFDVLSKIKTSAQVRPTGMETLLPVKKNTRGNGYRVNTLNGNPLGRVPSYGDKVLVTLKNAETGKIYEGMASVMVTVSNIAENGFTVTPVTQ